MPPSRQITVQKQYSGPIPDPADLEHYERIHRGAAERILRLAETEAEHRRGIENKAIDAQIEDAKSERWDQSLGQCLGFSIGVIALGLAAALGFYGHVWPAGLIGVGGVGAVAKHFIQGRGGKKQPEKKST